MVVALQRMIFDESLATLERAYALNGQNLGKSRWTGRLAFLKSHYFDHRRSPAVLTTPAKAN